MPDKLEPLSEREKQEMEDLEKEQARELLDLRKDKSKNTKSADEGGSSATSTTTDVEQLQAENAKLRRRIERLEKNNKVLESKLAQQRQAEMAVVGRRASFVRWSQSRTSSSRLHPAFGVPHISYSRSRNMSQSNPSGSFSAVSASAGTLMEQPMKNGTSNSAGTSGNLNSNANVMVDDETFALNNIGDDPEVDALLEKGPLTRESLQQLTIGKRKDNDLERAGFRMLMESKEDKHVAIEKIPEGVFHIPSVTKMQIKLKWVKEPRCAMLVKRPNDEQATKALVEIADFLRKKKLNIILEKSIEKELRGNKTIETVGPRFLDSGAAQHEQIDFIVCLGGDGTILWACGLFPKGIPPIVSFKMGSLGFLTPFDVQFYGGVLKNILNNDVEATVRSRLQVTVRKNGSEPRLFTCLNEVVVKHPSRMVSLDLFANDDKITVVHADGLIIATPTGSTAYSLACGGSMLHPALPAMVVTPIAPHTLSFRPIVLADSSTLKIAIPQEARNSAYLSFDGREQLELHVGDFVEVTLSEFPMAAYCLDGESSDWFNTIKQSFLWNVRTAQKELNQLEDAE